MEGLSDEEIRLQYQQQQLLIDELKGMVRSFEEEAKLKEEDAQVWDYFENGISRLSCIIMGIKFRAEEKHLGLNLKNTLAFLKTLCMLNFYWYFPQYLTNAFF